MLTLLESGTRKRMRWRNNLGWTTEIARAPDLSQSADPDAFLWRVSVAEIDADSDFSVFEGIDRSIAVIDGDGIVLVVDEDVHSVLPGHPAVRFAGEASTSCMLVAGPTRDFNVMTRRGACEHEVLTMQLLVSAPESLALGEEEFALIYLASGEANLRLQAERAGTGRVPSSTQIERMSEATARRGEQFHMGPGDSVLCEASVQIEGTGLIVLAKLRASAK